MSLPATISTALSSGVRSKMPNAHSAMSRMSAPPIPRASDLMSPSVSSSRSSRPVASSSLVPVVTAAARYAALPQRSLSTASRSRCVETSSGSSAGSLATHCDTLAMLSSGQPGCTAREHTAAHTPQVHSAPSGGRSCPAVHCGQTCCSNAVHRSTRRSPGSPCSVPASRPIARRMLLMYVFGNRHRPTSATSKVAMLSASKPACPSARAAAIWSRRSLIACLLGGVALRDRLQLGDRRWVVGECVPLRGHESIRLDRALRPAASLHVGDGRDHGLLVDVGVGVRRGGQVLVAQDFLGDLHPGRLVHLLRKAVPEHVRGHLHPEPGPQVAKRGLESGVSQGFPGSAPVSYPRRVGGRVAAFLGQVAVEDRPEVAGDRHSVLVTGSFEPHGDRRPSPVEVGQPHAQHAVPAVFGMPVAYPLPSADQQ